MMKLILIAIIIYMIMQNPELKEKIMPAFQTVIKSFNEIKDSINKKTEDSDIKEILKDSIDKK